MNIGNNKLLILRRFVVISFSAVLLVVLTVLFCNWYVDFEGSKYITDAKSIDKVDAIIVPGALIHSDILQDRMDVAIDLYKQGISKKILLTGDHGTKSYDEVNTMREYVQKKGVPIGAIFMDHAGFNTYDSMYRARDVFCVKKAVVVTQRYHLVRALYIGNKLGLDVKGVTSDLHIYWGMTSYLVRDAFSRTKAVMQTELLKPKPRFLGDAIPISGSGILTHDKK